MTHVPWHPSEVETEEVHDIASVELTSVGIDVGTTTSHLVFSRLLARRQGTDHSSEFQIVETETTHESEIRLTPYERATTIDADELGAFVQRAYDRAGYDVDDVDTGAVIVTGEASRKENAEAILDVFSERAGKFVCATAGANLEAVMAAHGSGAVDYSVDNDVDVLHVDIGGGSTKLAYVVGGFVEETASINVGAHLVAMDDDGTVQVVEDAAKRVADELGLDVERGERLGRHERERLADALVDLVFELVEDRPGDLARDLMVTELPDARPFDVVTFSGGVAEYVYDRDPGYHADLGPEMGSAIRDAVSEREIGVAELDAGIRATALGSTQHTVQVSGNTTTITDESVLPLRNVPMVPFVADEHESATEFTETVLDRLDVYDVDELDEPFAFGFHLHGTPRHDFLDRIAETVVEGWRRFDGDHPVVVAFDSDVAMNVGRLLEARVDVPVVTVDGAELHQFGYLDVGEPLEDTGAVPLTVKSLVFEG